MTILIFLASLLATLTAALVLAKSIVEYQSSLLKYQIDIANNAPEITISTAIQRLTKVKRDIVNVGGVSLIASISLAAFMIFGPLADKAITVASATLIALILCLVVIMQTCFIIGTKQT
ncbi:hypothetical protein [Sulfuricella denitrificans]|uniref:hypothetical protein n=1 Tax=Sulfuricella denitrificans TaxID=649841 RepID=UPI00059F4FFF|nr:hypothetical protein [Sulfuricella denitrificans]